MALLTLTSLPWVALAAARVGIIDRAALESALIEPRTVMTPVEICARLVALAMFAGMVWNVTALFTRIAGKRGGIAAGAIVVTNATLVYYAHTGNLEVPYLFWASWALLELDRVLAGEARELQAMAAVTCAVLTKRIRPRGSSCSRSPRASSRALGCCASVGRGLRGARPPRPTRSSRGRS